MHLTLTKASIGVVAGWILKQFRSNAKNQTKDKARINNIDVPLKEADILLFIQQQLDAKKADQQEYKAARKKHLGN